MASYSIFKVATGQIVRMVECPADTIEDQLEIDESFINGWFDDDLYYIDRGAAIQIPPSPSPKHEFDYINKVWVDNRSEADILAEEKEAVRVRRNVSLYSGIVVSGMLIPTDDVSQQRILGAALSAFMDSNYSVNWKLPDGTFVVLTAAQVLAISHAVRGHIQACFDREQELIGCIETGIQYDIESGWPN